MSREKKDSKSLNIKLDRSLSERFEAYCLELGQTKTTAIERILIKHLDEYNSKHTPADKTEANQTDRA